jgi:hypothetical protein
LIRSLINFVVLVGFTLTLPLFCIAAWGWGSKDEQWLTYGTRQGRLEATVESGD